jgi:hypothetical protein
MIIINIIHFFKFKFNNSLYVIRIDSIPNMQHPFLFPDESRPHNYKLKEHYFIIDSRDRDRTTWPSSSHFEVKLEPANTYTGATLGQHYKNIKSIELVSASYPTTGNSSNEGCLYLNIPELEGAMDGTNITSVKSFARLTPTTLTNSFVHCDLNNVPALTFEEQGHRLDKMTIQIKKVDDTIIDFGTDTSPPTAPNPLFQVNLLFKVTTVEPSVR